MSIEVKLSLMNINIAERKKKFSSDRISPKQTQFLQEQFRLLRGNEHRGRSPVTLKNHQTERSWYHTVYLP